MSAEVLPVCLRRVQHEVLLVPNQLQDFTDVPPLKRRNGVVVFGENWSGGVEEAHGSIVARFRHRPAGRRLQQPDRHSASVAFQAPRRGAPRLQARRRVALAPPAWRQRPNDAAGAQCGRGLPRRLVRHQSGQRRDSGGSPPTWKAGAGLPPSSFQRPPRPAAAPARCDAVAGRELPRFAAAGALRPAAEGPAVVAIHEIWWIGTWRLGRCAVCPGTPRGTTKPTADRQRRKPTRPERAGAVGTMTTNAGHEYASRTPRCVRRPSGPLPTLCARRMLRRACGQGDWSADGLFRSTRVVANLLINLRENPLTKQNLGVCLQVRGVRWRQLAKGIEHSALRGGAYCCRSVSCVRSHSYSCTTISSQPFGRLRGGQRC